MVPALISQGLLKTKDFYTVPHSHYYGLESIMLTIAFMALARIKSPEQLKQCKPGEIGRIIGLDRIPEVSCLRQKLKLLSDQNQSSHLNQQLVDYWYQDEATREGFLYIDGHVRIYYGAQANLPSKYVSRQKLCLHATTEYWVNDAQGLPVLMVMGELTEKLTQVIEQQIIPQLQQTVLLKQNEEQQNTSIEKEKEEQEQDIPSCTLIFDREAYEPKFFQRLWDKYHIAVITYRKNVKDLWDTKDFLTNKVVVLEQTITMQLCEKEITLEGIPFREVRKLNENGHQTSILTNNKHIDMSTIAGRMFGRWSQENFFRYMIYDYDFDKMIQFGTQEVDPNKEVVNPEYRRINQQIKKVREKIQRLKAQLFPILEQSMDQPIDSIPKLTAQQIKINEKLERFQLEEANLLSNRAPIKQRIKLSEMPQQERYNKLKQESKLFMNIIKMICYRAETTVANILSDKLINATHEKRMLVKQIIQANADIYPDYSNNTLTVKLHSLSTPRFNQAVQYLALVLTESETYFPGSPLKLIFKTSA